MKQSMKANGDVWAVVVAGTDGTGALEVVERLRHWPCSGVLVGGATLLHKAVG